MTDKEKIMLMESTIVNWVNQVKQVIKLEPEVMLLEPNPSPLKEIQFWGIKAANLKHIEEQLQNERAQNIIKTLKENESTYVSSLMKIIEEVATAKDEALSNFEHLNPMKSIFEQIKFDSSNPVEFTEFPDVFKKMFYYIYLVWTKSKYYVTTPRLTVLIREICYDLIGSARNYISKDVLQAESSEALEKLGTTLTICTLFKKYYFRDRKSVV